MSKVELRRRWQARIDQYADDLKPMTTTMRRLCQNACRTGATIDDIEADLQFDEEQLEDAENRLDALRVIVAAFDNANDVEQMAALVLRWMDTDKPTSREAWWAERRPPDASRPRQAADISARRRGRPNVCDQFADEVLRRWDLIQADPAMRERSVRARQDAVVAYMAGRIGLRMVQEIIAKRQGYELRSRQSGFDFDVSQ
jgi:hypothetical protein